jgi:hypothetical protein
MHNRLFLCPVRGVPLTRFAPMRRSGQVNAGEFDGSAQWLPSLVDAAESRRAFTGWDVCFADAKS